MSGWWREPPADEDRIGARDLTRWPSWLGRRLVRLVLRLAEVTSVHAAVLIITAIGLVITVGLTAAGGGVYDAVTESDGIAALDVPVLDWVIGHRGATITSLVNGFTQLGGPIGMPIIAGLLTVIMVIAWRSRTPLVVMIIGVAGSLTITAVGKAVVGRSRPPLVDAVPPYEFAPSFPSGHALNSTVIAGLIGYLILRRLRAVWARALTVAVAACWALAIGLSRVFLGHHWLTDVVFGWLVGTAWLALVITVHRLYLSVHLDRAPRLCN